MRYADVRIETQRLLLRPFEMNDAQSWFQMMSSPEVTRYWSHLPWLSLQEAKEDIVQDITHMERKEYLRLAVIDKTSGVMQGMCVFFNHYPNSQRGEIGYCLDTQYQGKGIMKEAMAAFIDYLQTYLSVRRLEADIHPSNKASAALLEKLGFEQEGYLKQRWVVGDEISDSAIYGLLLTTKTQ